jgi:hypothetical protein
MGVPFAPDRTEPRRGTPFAPFAVGVEERVGVRLPAPGDAEGFAVESREGVPAAFRALVEDILGCGVDASAE